MTRKVNSSPALPRPPYAKDFGGVAQFELDIVRRVETELRDHAQRLNTALTNDGTEAATAPVLLKVYAKAALPAAATYPAGLVAVSDEIGGYTIAFSDGTNWRRVQDRAVVS